MQSIRADQTVSRVGIAIATAVAGATAMYLLDPQSGRRRRAMIRDQFDRGIHDGGAFLRKANTDARQRARGLYRQTRALLRKDEVDDSTLELRVRAQLGRLTSHPRAIRVSCSDRTVCLRGDVLENEVDAVVRGVQNVRGVGDVRNELQVRTDFESVPGMQGNGQRRPKAQFEYLQDNWSPAPRLLAGAVGLALLAGSLGRQPATATSLALMGAAALLRSISNRPLSNVFGARSDDREGILVEKTIHVNAYAEDAYRLWRDLENLPNFMSHVREVSRIDERLYRWKVDGPADVPIEWTAEITAEVPGELIAWRATPDSAVQSSGVVQFEPSSAGTRIHVRLTYRPPAGEMGHTVAKIFGKDPKRQMDDDLLRFKSWVETRNPDATPESTVRH